MDFIVEFGFDVKQGKALEFQEVASYGAQDVLSTAMKEGGAFAILVDEANQFVDQDRGAYWSNGLYKSVTEIGFWSGA
jgi:hypothetical protein